MSQDGFGDDGLTATPATHPVEMRIAQRFYTDEVMHPTHIPIRCMHAGDQASSLPGRDFLGFREALHPLQFVIRLHCSFKPSDNAFPSVRKDDVALRLNGGFRT